MSCHFWECWDWISDWISSSLTFGSLEKIYRNCLGEFITVWWQFSHIKTHKTKIINRFQNHPEPSLSPAPALDRPKTAEFYFPERDLGILLAGFLSGQTCPWSQCGAPVSGLSLIQCAGGEEVEGQVTRCSWAGGPGTGGPDGRILLENDIPENRENLISYLTTVYRRLLYVFDVLASPVHCGKVWGVTWY